MPVKIPKRANMTKLMEIADTSDVTLRKHIRKADIPKGKDGKYNVQKVLNAILEHRKNDNRAIPDGALSKIRATKGTLECQILKVKLDQLKGATIPMEEHLAELNVVAGIFKSVLNQWMEAVKTSGAGVGLVKAAEKLETISMKRLRDRIEAEGEIGS